MVSRKEDSMWPREEGFCGASWGGLNGASWGGLCGVSLGGLNVVSLEGLLWCLAGRTL